MYRNKIWLTIFALLMCVLPLKANVWEKIENIPPPYSENYWLDVFFLPDNPNYGWICGYQGMILRTTDRGATWSGTTINTNYHLESVHFVNPYVGYTSGVPGIFKTVDGGVTWTDISTQQMVEGGIWGCYFISENVGLAIGGGCNLTGQHFWRTTNGGQSWSLFQLDDPNSGLTDAMIYSENGLGYAAGSGKIYTTTDGGQSWSLFFNTETADYNNRWQEEITNIGSSFLVPYSGDLCGGGGNSGGMYFTTNNGQTINRYATGTQMYGTFLISEQVGWACGYNGAVYYTENAGNTWTKRSCGISPAVHLDDIWFISPTEGWVVGNGGVYKLSNSVRDLSSDEIAFRSTCYPDVQFGQVTLYNNSFETVQITCNVTQEGYVSEFYSFAPEAGDIVSVNPCDSIVLTVEFAPRSVGYKEAYLNVIFNGTEQRSVHLSGFASGSTAKAAKSMIDFDTVYCNTARRDSIAWTATYPNEYIDSCKFISGRDAFACPLDSNFKLGEAVKYQYFDFTPLDTGYYEAVYRSYLQPCSVTKHDTLRGYAVSSIINGRDTVITMDCPPVGDYYVKIPISNTGNYPLTINDLQLSNKNFIYSGFVLTDADPAEIPIGGVDSMIIRARISGKNGADTCRILIINNDSTKVGGDKNPYEITVIINSNFTSLDAELLSVPNSVICIGETTSLDFSLENTTRLSGDFLYNIEKENCDVAISPRLVSPFLLNAYNKNNYTLEITPSAPGEYYAKVIFSSEKCGVIDSIVVRGRAENFDVDISLEEIAIRLLTDEPDSLDLSIHSLGNSVARLDSVRLKNPFPELDFRYTPETYTFTGDESIDMRLYFLCSKDTVYTDTLLLYFSGICPKVVAIPVEIICGGARLNASAGAYEPNILCDMDRTIRVPVTITNYGSADDELLRIECVNQTNGVFELHSIDLPRKISPNEDLTCYLDFTPLDTGRASAEIRFYSERMSGNYIVVISKFYSARTDLSPARRSHDLGAVEYCEEAIIDTFEIENAGNLDAEVKVCIMSENAIREISDINFTVPAFGAVKQTLTIRPAEIRNYGMNYDTLAIINQTCGDTIYHDVKIFKIFTETTLDREDVAFDDLWAGVPSYDTLELSNNSNIPLTLRRVEISGEGAEYVSIGGISPGDELAIGEKRKIFVQTLVDKECGIEAKVAIDYETSCPLEDSFTVTGAVPEEIYYVNFASERYEKEPNEAFEIKIFNKSAPAKYAKVDSVMLALNYDPNIISRSNVLYGENSLDIRHKQPDLRFVLAGEAAEKFVNTTGDSVVMKSIAMLAVPDSCTLNISDVEIYSPKRIIASTENGFFRIINYCRGAAQFMKYETIDVAASVKNPNNVAVTIECKSNKSVDFNIAMVDVLGNAAYSNTINIDGVREIKLDTGTLTSGYYIVVVKVFDKVISQEKVLLVR